MALKETNSMKGKQRLIEIRTEQPLKFLGVMTGCLKLANSIWTPKELAENTRAALIGI